MKLPFGSAPRRLFLGQMLWDAGVCAKHVDWGEVPAGVDETMVTWDKNGGTCGNADSVHGPGEHGGCVENDPPRIC
jgi:hypothetical protein